MLEAIKAEQRGGGMVTDSETKVTIVITCFNYALFLSDAIESALNQTIRAAEIILVDDGSTDDTAEVAARYPMVGYVWQRNQGLSAARNTGLAVASGDFIVFLDADDRLLPSALDAGLRCFEAHPECAFVSGRHRRIDRHGAVTKFCEPTSIGAHPYLGFLRGNYVGMHATVLYRRSVFEIVGGFDTTLSACEDYDMYLRIARRYPVVQHDDLVAEYRQHGTNMSNDVDLMLKTALTILRAQARHVGDDQERRDAFEMGIENWRDYYALVALTGGPGGVGPRQARLIIWAALRLLRHPPKGLGAKLYRRTRRTARVALEAVLPGTLRSLVLGPRVGNVKFGDLRRTRPIARGFGYGRGRPVDRYYIEHFLARHATDVHGRVLEVGDDNYTRRYGQNRVERGDVLHAVPGNPRASFVGDLGVADQIPSNAFNCVILTQTLHLIYDVHAALRTLHRILKPGGVLLLTVPGISQLDECGRPEDNKWGNTWYWAFTTLSIRRACVDTFAGGTVEVEAHGNVLATVAYLHGLADHELTRAELDDHDPLYQLVITARVVKGGPS
jgi:SAM-dependent methyltransferase